MEGLPTVGHPNFFPNCWGPNGPSCPGTLGQVRRWGFLRLPEVKGHPNDVRQIPEISGEPACWVAWWEGRLFSLAPDVSPVGEAVNVIRRWLKKSDRIRGDSFWDRFIVAEEAPLENNFTGPGENETASVRKTPDMVPSPLEDVLEANAGGEMALDILVPTGEGDGASGSLGEKDLTKGLGDEGTSEPRASGDGPGVILQEASGDSLLAAETEVPEGKPPVITAEISSEGSSVGQSVPGDEKQPEVASGGSGDSHPVMMPESCGERCLMPAQGQPSDCSPVILAGTSGESGTGVMATPSGESCTLSASESPGESPPVVSSETCSEQRAVTAPKAADPQKEITENETARKERDALLVGERVSNPGENRGEASLSTLEVLSEDLFHSPAGTEIHSPRSEKEPEGMLMEKGTEVSSSTPKRGPVPRESDRGETAGERAPPRSPQESRRMMQSPLPKSGPGPNRPSQGRLPARPPVDVNRQQSLSTSPVIAPRRRAGVLSVEELALTSETNDRLDYGIPESSWRMWGEAILWRYRFLYYDSVPWTLRWTSSRDDSLEEYHRNLVRGE